MQNNSKYKTIYIIAIMVTVLRLNKINYKGTVYLHSIRNNYKTNRNST